MMVQSFQLEDEAAADYFLRSLLENPQYRSISEIEARAQKLIPNARVRSHFISEGRKALKLFEQA